MAPRRHAPPYRPPVSVHESVTAAHALLQQALHTLDVDRARIQGRIDMLMEIRERIRAARSVPDDGTGTG